MVAGRKRQGRINGATGKADREIVHTGDATARDHDPASDYGIGVR